MTRQFGGFKPMGDGKLSFSGLDFTPMEMVMQRDPSALLVSSPPQILNRPEGDWDRPGVLEGPGCEAPGTGVAPGPG